MSRFTVVAAIVLAASACGVNTTDTSSGEDTQGTAGQDLAGGCRAVCPKCHPGEICPMYMCYLSCPSPQKPVCGVRAACALGYEWSESRCSCVVTPGRPGSCSSDADCRLEASYCNGCSCSALSNKDGASVCSGTTVNCFADPCLNQVAICSGGTCQLK